MSEEPDGDEVAAVEVDVGERGELGEDVVGEALGVVEDDDRLEWRTPAASSSPYKTFVPQLTGSRVERSTPSLCA